MEYAYGACEHGESKCPAESTTVGVSSESIKIIDIYDDLVRRQEHGDIWDTPSSGTIPEEKAKKYWNMAIQVGAEMGASEHVIELAEQVKDELGWNEDG